MNIFKTARLSVRTAAPEDAGFLYHLWTHPDVMHNVGFPNGLKITKEEILRKITDQENVRREKAKQQITNPNNTVYDRYLVITLQGTDDLIGECKLGYPNNQGIATTDVKILPEYWGHKYGSEIKRGLLKFLFENTVCIAVEATPNVSNAASIKMQEAAGGVRVGEGTYYFPEKMKDFTRPVHHYIYRVTREAWERHK
ncbi:MAG: GNAT family N-acetyltransferase [Candidatus Eisenbacteria bacterium]|uniref:GNAT family N-acetyltransferase n=1 Tax=Eiseniibacteriota bacterium TaxID=2212470 RepID=A0A948RZX5_UNCEI|nr:GNAT family N-acetyltransferase [Candidatus Eisenbacteria bacterium]MBU1948516.1 GNAT family N-acetyltransferase [Candidatus Eisenbacteria bacterium]MBU2692669.1 GNAT family N-acetyltransferase [Candidatus Eisenbacteria bacterium]